MDNDIVNEVCLFKFKVKYTKNEYLKLNKFYVYVMYRYIHILIYALITVIFSLNLYTKAGFGITLFSILGIIIYTIVVYFMPYIYIAMKKNMLNINLQVSFDVYDKFLEVKTNKSDIKERKYYSSIVKVYETKSHFYVYVSNTSAYIVPKKSIAGNISNFRNILKRNLKKKYVSVI